MIETVKKIIISGFVGALDNNYYCNEFLLLITYKQYII